MTTKMTILNEIGAVAGDLGLTLAPLTDDLPLLESGLDSLGFAILVSRLEDVTGRDPFASASASRYPKTIGDLVDFYDKVLV
jgi:acyl carrier protein